MSSRKFNLRIPATARHTPWISPYANGKPAFSTPAPRPGLYVISSRTGKVVYVGYSRVDVKKTAYRHFQKWEEQNHNHATYPKTGYKIRFILGIPTDRLQQYEQALIRRLQPAHNGIRYTPHQWQQITQDISDMDIDKLLNHGVDDDMPF